MVRVATAVAEVAQLEKPLDFSLVPPGEMVDSQVVAVVVVELDILVGLVVLAETVEMVASESGPRLRVFDKWQLPQHNHQR